MKKYFFGLLLFIWGCDKPSNMDTPDKNYFLKYYGQDGNQTAVDLIANADGTFFILGNSKRLSSDTLSIYLAKANALGEMLWQKTYAYNNSLQTEARDFELTSDGKLAVVANTTSNGDTDILLARFTLDGTFADETILQIDQQLAPSPVNEYANSVTELYNGGFIVTGYTDFVSNPNNQYSALHLRTNSSLQQLHEDTDHWRETTYPGTTNIGVKAFQTITDTSYIFGYSNALNTNLSFWTFGMTPNGYLPSSDDPTEFINATANDYLTNVIKAPQGYLMSGVSVGTSGTMSLKLIKLQYNDLTFYGSGNPMYNEVQSVYTSSSGSLGKGNVQYATACNSSSGYFALTNIYTSNGTSDLLLMKFNYSLQPIWTNPVQLGGNGNDTSAAVAELPDGHIIVLGTINVGTGETTKIALMKLNANGQLTE